MANGYPDPYAQPQPQPMFGDIGALGQGMFGGLRRGFQRGGQALHPYSNRLLLAGLGMLGGGPKDAMKGLVAGSALDTEDADRRKLNTALQALMNSESDLIPDDPAIRGLMAADPKFGEATLLQRMKPADIGEKYQGYLNAKAEGYQGDWMQYQADTKAAGVTVNTGDYKVPAGYQPVDPNNPDAGVEPIPGGPGEQLPAELAARIGLTNSFLSQAPAIKQRLNKGGATGIWDRSRAGWDDSSEQAALYRQIESGADALTRMLTGAGMRIDEAQTYSRRYLPTYTDDNVSAAKKLDQLVQELKSMKEQALRGRGGTDEPSQNDDPLGLGL
jgi:hypothetical protein